MATLIETGIPTIPGEMQNSKDFIAKTSDGTLAEFKLSKVHKRGVDPLVDLAKREGSYKTLVNVAAIAGIVDAGIFITGGFLETKNINVGNSVIYAISVLGTAGAITYFGEKVKECQRKINQIKLPNSLPTIK